MKNTPKEIYMVIVISLITIGVFALLFLGRVVPPEILMIFGGAVGGFFGFSQHRNAVDVRNTPTAEQEIRLIEAKTDNNNSSEPPVI